MARKHSRRRVVKMGSGFSDVVPPARRGEKQPEGWKPFTKSDDKAKRPKGTKQ